MSRRWRRALVTGGTAGIGRALSRRLAGKNCEVVVVDRQPPDDQWGEASTGRIRFIATDLADAGAVDRLPAGLVGLGPFDLVIHSAGVSATGRFERIPSEAYERLIAVNVEAPLALAADMLAAGCYARRANLVFIASLSHATGYPGAAVYAASKDALAIYARSIRKPFARSGIAVTCVFPGPVRTGHAARHAPPGALERRRMAPERLAALVLSAAARGRADVYPGVAARLCAIAGRLAPDAVTAAMRRLVFDKLDRDVW